MPYRSNNLRKCNFKYWMWFQVGLKPLKMESTRIQHYNIHKKDEELDKYNIHQWQTSFINHLMEVHCWKCSLYKKTNILTTIV